MQCVACGCNLEPGFDPETYLCKNCTQVKEMAEMKKEKKIFEWSGKLDINMNLNIDEKYDGEYIKIEVYTLGRDKSNI